MKLRMISFFLLIAIIFGMMPASISAAWTSQYAPYVKIDDSYSASVSCGTIRYISQIPNSYDFHSSYWPTRSFGGYSSPKNECGTASISMALSYIGINKTPKIILETNNGYTYFTGWGATTSTPTVSDGMNRFINGKGKYSPVIIHLPNFSASGHWVILFSEVSANVYQVLDPATQVPWNITINGNSAVYTNNGRTIYDTIDRTYQYYNANANIHNGENCPSSRFYDVQLSDWFHESVDFAVSRGLFGGMSEDRFEPNIPMTRAMLATVLWRHAGQPSAGSNSFVDVPTNQWYSKAVAWAAYSGIVSGVGDNRFVPNANISREQIAVILYRYANINGMDTSARADLSKFSDANKVSGYASNAICWAVAEGLIYGNDGKLMPQGNADRAQVAAILMRFIENIVK